MPKALVRYKKSNVKYGCGNTTKRPNSPGEGGLRLVIQVYVTGENIGSRTTLLQ